VAELEPPFVVRRGCVESTQRQVDWSGVTLADKNVMLIRISKSVDKELSRVARRTGRTKAQVAQDAIEIYLPIFEEMDREERKQAQITGRMKRMTLREYLKRRLPW
jgi:predicted transcriptional regulator